MIVDVYGEKGKRGRKKKIIEDKLLAKEQAKALKAKALEEKKNKALELKEKKEKKGKKGKKEILLCIAILKTGLRKGEACDKNALENNLCKRHSK